MALSTKDKIIAILDSHKGVAYSGQELADQIGVSRQAINKAIKSLRDEGLDIVGSTKLGYTLSEDTDLLNADSIAAMLSSEAKDFYRIECVDVTESTNNDVRMIAYSGESEGYVRVAAEQTQGKGRRGRNFSSPGLSGVYLSILLRPDISAEDWALITTASAVAAAKACQSMLDEDDNTIAIKWVNDIYRGKKKIAGILTEAGMDMETASLDFAVMGIGFNVTDPIGGWSKELVDIAGSLFGDTAPVSARSRLVAEFLENFYSIYIKLPDVSYLSDYRDRQLVLGRQVTVIEADGNKRLAQAIDVDDKCHLIVRYLDDDSIAHLDSGEISVKL